MYDPELALQRERDLLENEIGLAKIAEQLGDDHPWTKRFALAKDIILRLAQKEQEFDNCFDPDVQSRIKLEIKELISIAREAIDTEK